MKNTKSALLIILFACMGYGKKHYTKASVYSMMELLKNLHKIDIKRRWIFACLKYFEDEGLIKRKKRYVRQPDGTLKQISSMITFTLKGAKQLYRMGVSGANKLLNSIKSWLKRKDGRFPKIGDIIPKISDEERKEEGVLIRKFLSNLA